MGNTGSVGLVLATLLLGVAHAALPHPSHSRCATEETLAKLPFCNASLPTDARVADLVGRLTTVEKISLMGQRAKDGKSAGVDRLGVAPLPWGEALHGVVSHCYIDALDSNATYCPTSFPHALALAASFNRTLWHAVGDRISTEGKTLFALNPLCSPSSTNTGSRLKLVLSTIWERQTTSAAARTLPSCCGPQT